MSEQSNKQPEFDQLVKQINLLEKSFEDIQLNLSSV
jgi:hypothetical protein